MLCAFGTKALVAVSLVASIGSSALAEGIPPIWQAAYVGVNVGGDWQRAAISDTLVLSRGREDRNSPIAGIHAGYNFDTAHAVFGVEVDYVRSIARDGAGPEDLGQWSNFNSGHHGLATLRAKAGIPIGWALIYATAGVAVTEVEARTATTDRSSIEFGSVLGGGLEVQLGLGLSARLEALRYSFHDKPLHWQGTEFGRINISDTVVRTGLRFALR